MLGAQHWYQACKKYAPSPHSIVLLTLPVSIWNYVWSGMMDWQLHKCIVTLWPN